MSSLGDPVPNNSVPNNTVTVDHDRVVVSGDIDVVSAASIEQVIRRVEERLAADQPVVIDVRDVGFIDSSGLRVLLAASRRAAAADRRVVLVHPRTALLRLLDITSTTSMFDLSGDPVLGD